MNRDIIELREVIQKLVPLLAGKGLVVTQRGSRAYVETDPRTKQPMSVNIPNITDNATPEFISAISGFIDHEVAHVLHTDWHYYGGKGGMTEKDLRDPKRLAFMNTHNIIEDVMIEREMAKTFPGSARNLSTTRKWFLSKITDEALKGVKDPKEQFRYVLVPMMRALGGHEEMQDWMDARGMWKHPLVEELLKTMQPATLELLKNATTTKETLVVAEEVHDILMGKILPPPPPAPSTGKPDPKQKPQKGCQSQDKPEKEAGEGDGDGERDHSKSKPGKNGKGEKSEQEDEGAGSAGEADESESKSGKSKGKPEKDKKDEDESEEEASAGGDEAEGENDAEDGEEETDGDDAGDDDGSEEDASDDAGDDEGDGDDTDGEADGKPEDDADGADDGEKEEAEEGGENDDSGEDAGDDDGASDAESGDDGDDPSDDDEGGRRNEVASVITSGADAGGVGEVGEGSDQESQGGGGGVGNAGAKSMFDYEDGDFEEVDMASQIAIKISDEAVAAMDPRQYLVFTREMDEIKPVKLPSEMNPKWVPQLEDETRQMTAKMQKDIERMMASKSHVIRTPGHRNGKLHAPSLFRVPQGDPRVFSQKQEHVSKDTAVEVVVDNSGSMGGQKMHLAMTASYALCSTLDRVKIAHEVIGFTTGGWYGIPQSIRDAMAEDAKRAKINWDRTTPLVLPIYKTFDERLTATVKARFAFMKFAQAGLAGNVDGESLEYAAERLLKRQEQRKVMMVLSDGQPAGSHKCGPHLSAVVKQLGKMGIECIGIGIMDDSVSRYYPKYTVLKRAEDLPGQVMTEIKKILTSN